MFLHSAVKQVLKERLGICFNYIITSTKPRVNENSHMGGIKMSHLVSLLWFICELALVQIKYNYCGEKQHGRYEGGGEQNSGCYSVTVC